MVASNTASIEGDGMIVLDATCSGGALTISGNLSLTDNASGAVTVTDDARIDVVQVGDAVLDEVFEGTTTFRQYLRLAASALYNKLSGAATSTVRIRDEADGKDRIVATVDTDGNRTAVTLDKT